MQPVVSWFRTAGGATRAPAVILAVAASMVAAQVHAWAAPEHLSLQPLLGVGFLVTAFLQGSYAAALMSRTDSVWLIRLGLVGNVALILLGLAAHNPDNPIGVWLAHQHAPGTQLLEQMAVASEAATVAGLAHLLTARRR